MKRIERWLFRKSPLAGLLLIMVIAGGCTTTKQYATLAEAGANYTGAVAALADKASAIKAETTSYRLLQERRNSIAKKHAWTAGDSLILARRLGDADLSDSKALGDNRVSMKVARNLHDYFAALQAMAASSAPADIGTKTGDLVKQLNATIAAAGGSATSDIPVNSAIVTTVMTRVTEAELKKELTERRRTLVPALTMLDNIMAAVKSGMAKDLSKLKTQRYLRLVETPFADGRTSLSGSISDEDLWIRSRVKHYSGTDEDAEVRNLVTAAETSSAAFRKVFDKMTSNSGDGYSIDELDSAVSDINQFSGIVQSFSKGE
ncbi:MAG TPA: hypothetical protein VN371_01775 [Chlorobaculum sp.]|nr:hypothetical protein [Chlorobaculum sp.]